MANLSYPILALVAALAFGVPLIAIAINHDVRLTRLRLLAEMLRNFGGFGKIDRPTGSTGEDLPFQTIPSFDLVYSKYICDLDTALSAEDMTILQRPIGHAAGILQYNNVMRKVTNLSTRKIRSNYKIIVSSIPYAILTFLGFYVAICHFILEIPCFSDWLRGTCKTFSLDPSGGKGLTVLMFGFLGAYLFSLKVIGRAIAIFDLSSRTFFQMFRHIFSNVVVVGTLWLGSGLVSTTTTLVGATPAVSDAFWILAAFLLGFVPDSGFWWLANIVTTTGPLKGRLTMFKRMDDRFTGYTRSTPLDLIDGIDMFTRLRLEDMGIYEMQNLATHNPIMLNLESPYGLFECIDWVAQAQLCTVTGPERYLLLRQLNVRTIFDLERAVLSLRSTHSMRQMIGNILIAPNADSDAFVKEFGLKMRIDGTGPLFDSYSAFSAKLGEEMAGDETYLFRRRVADRLKPGSTPVAPPLPKAGYVASYADLNGKAGARSATNVSGTDYDAFTITEKDATIRHMVRVIMDDLHVVRLRQIWEWIDHSIGQDARTLDDTAEYVHGP